VCERYTSLAAGKTTRHSNEWPIGWATRRLQHLVKSLRHLAHRSSLVILTLQVGAWLAANAAGGLLPQLGWRPQQIEEVLVGGAIAFVGVTAWGLVESREKTDGEIKRLTAQLREREREVGQALIDGLLEQITRVLGQPGLTTRCNVFLIGSDNRLRNAYHHGMANQPDRDIVFDKWQGCTGHAWGTGQQVAADLSKVSPDDLIQIWKLTPTQISVTRGLGAILSTPIEIGRDKKIVGILSIDSDGNLETSKLGEPAALDIALQSAVLLARMLIMAGECDVA
jgi:hypothetical protein